MMKFFLSFFILIQINYSAAAQNFSGQWKGEFIDKSTKFMGWGGDKCEYVLDLECKDKKITGYSYTYFEEGGKRFYTICKLEGFYDTRKKYVEIKETERTKTNVPAEVRNCFQVHKLTFYKIAGADETLEGNWVPAPNQEGNCGFGLTTLSRRALKNSFPGFKSTVVKPTLKTAIPSTGNNKKIPDLADKNKIIVNPRVATVRAKPALPAVVIPKKDSPVKIPERLTEPTVKTIPKISSTPGLKFEKRNNTILKTIEVENESIKIDLYDNGEIDGDSVSLFLNGKLMVARKKLTTQPLTIRIPREELEDENELVMYAENLGSIPPNTALMVVTDGSKRYEVRITSDLQKSGTIRFVKKK
jgi:hypothetical protein